MRLKDFLQEDRLEEKIKLRHVLAGAALGAALTTGAVVGHGKYQAHKQEVQAKEKAAAEKSAKEKSEAEEKARIADLKAAILEKYKSNIAPHEAENVVKLAIKHETPKFSAEDLLAQIGVESSFKKTATSKLKKDPAVGYTQIRPGVWGMKAHDLKGNVEKQIKTTYDILTHYYQKLGNKEDAWHAYNVGLTNFKKKKGLNPEYAQKIKHELKRYES